MSAEDVAVFDGIAGKWLDNSRYMRGNYLESQTVKRRIEYCLTWWEKEGKPKGVKVERKHWKLC